MTKLQNYKITKLQNYKITKFLLISFSLFGCGGCDRKNPKEVGTRYTVVEPIVDPNFKLKKITPQQNVTPPKNITPPQNVTPQPTPTYNPPPPATPTKKLFDAVQAGDLNKVNEAINEGADINAKNSEGMRPLRDAVIKGRLDIIKKLVEHGAIINEKDILYGETLLWYACFLGSLEIVKYLVEKGADINAENRGGPTPLYIATINSPNNNHQKYEILYYLLTSCTGENGTVKINWEQQKVKGVDFFQWFKTNTQEFQAFDQYLRQRGTNAENFFRQVRSM